jgi:hypothetical protein
MREPSLADIEEWKEVERRLIAQDFMRMGLDLPECPELASIADYCALIGPNTD